MAAYVLIAVGGVIISYTLDAVYMDATVAAAGKRGSISLSHHIVRSLLRSVHKLRQRDVPELVPEADSESHELGDCLICLSKMVGTLDLLHFINSSTLFRVSFNTAIRSWKAAPTTQRKPNFLVMRLPVT